MPISGFQWLTQNEIDSLDLLKVDDNATGGYIVKLDLQYPESLHLLHIDYPLAAEYLDINGEILYEWQVRSLKDIYNKTSNSYNAN